MAPLLRPNEPEGTKIRSPRPALQERFTVTNDHLRLLRSARVVWRDGGSGAPAIDRERPYGSRSADADIARILGKYAGNRGVLRAIHGQMRTVLQIVLFTGLFEPGSYERIR